LLATCYFADVIRNVLYYWHIYNQNKIKLRLTGWLNIETRSVGNSYIEVVYPNKILKEWTFVGAFLLFLINVYTLFFGVKILYIIYYILYIIYYILYIIYYILYIIYYINHANNKNNNYFLNEFSIHRFKELL